MEINLKDKMLSRQACINRYGAIDFATKHWPDQNKWIKILEIPQGLFPDWKIGETNLPVRHIACNVDLHEPLLNALKAIAKAGRAGELLTYDGCFNIRMVRGSNDHFSAHSYGLAIDLNCDLNPLGQQKGLWSNEFIQCFKEQGFDYGGDFSGRKDPMHFSRCWE